ncbi:hypothetical protein SDC9_106356 [bioreactor metagenome]|uniref:Uncharacterized protein n=1 Tax=bioreactor metagenome TaxID=1076179 RepID=A0A645B237_9ZZZZ
MRPLRGPAVRAKNDSPRGSVRALRIGGAKPKKCGVNYLFAGSCIIPAFAKDVKSLQNKFPLSAPPHDRFSGHTVWATRCGETKRQGPLDCGEGRIVSRHQWDRIERPRRGKVPRRGFLREQRNMSERWRRRTPGMAGF